MSNYTTVESEYIYLTINYVDIFIAVPFVIIILSTLFCYTLLKDKSKRKRIHPQPIHSI